MSATTLTIDRARVLQEERSQNCLPASLAGRPRTFMVPGVLAHICLCFQHLDDYRTW